MPFYLLAWSWYEPLENTIRKQVSRYVQLKQQINVFVSIKLVCSEADRQMELAICKLHLNNVWYNDLLKPLSHRGKPIQQGSLAKLQHGCKFFENVPCVKGRKNLTLAKVLTKDVGAFSWPAFSAHVQHITQEHHSFR